MSSQRDLARGGWLWRRGPCLPGPACAGHRGVLPRLRYAKRARLSKVWGFTPFCWLLYNLRSAFGGFCPSCCVAGVPGTSFPISVEVGGQAERVAHGQQLSTAEG